MRGLFPVPALFLLSACGLLPPPTPLDQPVPGRVPEPFAPEVTATGVFTLNSAFTPSGDEFFFTRRVDGRLTMFRMERDLEGWSDPVELQPFEDPGDAPVAVDMMVSPDGLELWFVGTAPNAHLDANSRLDLWVSRRTSRGWEAAEMLPPPWSTEHQEVYPCVVADGSLWFSSRRPGGLGGSDLWRAQRRLEGGFDAPVNVGAPLNSPADQGDTFVAPDESWLIVTMPDEDGQGQSDLHIAFRRPDGGWTAPRNLGPTINSDGHDYCPMLSPDGRFLFFSRRWGPWNDIERSEVVWVDASVLEGFRR